MPSESPDGGVLTDGYGRREYVLKTLNQPLATTDVQIATGVVDSFGREHIVLLDQGNILGGVPFNVKDYGAVGDGVHDDTASIQAAYDAAKAACPNGFNGARVYWPHGNYATSAPITYLVSENACVSTIGDGPDAVKILPVSDLGAGHGVLEPVDYDGSANLRSAKRGVIQGIKVRGPSAGSFGVAPCAMHGIIIPSSFWIVECKAEQFKAGIEGCGDHWQAVRCVCSGNLYGIYFGREVGAEADQVIDGCDLTSNLRASIGVMGSNLIGSCRISSTHLGYGPYGIWKESPAGVSAPYVAQPGAVVGCTFVDTSCESYSHAFIACETTGDVTDNVFINCPQANAFGAATIVGESQEASIRCTNFLRNRASGDLGALITKGTLCGIKATNTPDAIYFDVPNINDLLLQWPLLNPAESGFPGIWLQTYSGPVYSITHASAACNQNDVLMFASGGMQPIDGTHPPAGVAAVACAGAGPILVQNTGYVPSMNADVASADPNGGYVKAAGGGALKGKVTKATGWTDGPLIGVASSGISGGHVAVSLGVGTG